MTSQQWQDYVLTTPGPVEWDCFRFAIIQRDDHFTLCISVDHLHFDATFIGTIFVEIRSMYDVLMDGGVPIPLQEVGSYAEYCLRERAYTSGLTLESPEIRQWIEFFEQNGGSLPHFPLPLGDTSLLAAGAVLSLQLMDARQTADFEAASRTPAPGSAAGCSRATRWPNMNSPTHRPTAPSHPPAPAAPRRNSAPAVGSSATSR